MSGEHRGSYTDAEEIVLQAKWAGADAVKLQCFDPDRLAGVRGGRDKLLDSGLWKGRTLGDLYAETHTPQSWFLDLFECAREARITIFSSVFDEEGVDFLETLGCPAYKIASFELTNLGLIGKAASTGKPVILSTGMASDEEVGRALVATVHNGMANSAVLHCVSAYPCPIEEANLQRIETLRYRYQVPVGLSDHTTGIVAPIVATALGACIIEKHLTLDRHNGGPDAAFSLESPEFNRMVRNVEQAYASLGTGLGERSEDEAPYRDLRSKG
jgi:N-acetylneuraminate synthase